MKKNGQKAKQNKNDQCHKEHSSHHGEIILFPKNKKVEVLGQSYTASRSYVKCLLEICSAIIIHYLGLEGK
jgi:hypothetical protein